MKRQTHARVSSLDRATRGKASGPSAVIPGSGSRPTGARPLHGAPGSGAAPDSPVGSVQRWLCLDVLVVVCPLAIVADVGGVLAVPAALSTGAPAPAPAVTPIGWSGDAAVALLRDALSRRRLPLDVLDGPMVPERFYPEGPSSDRPRRAGAACGDWRVLTAAGRWWVQPSGYVEPADSMAWGVERRAFGEDER